MSKRFPYDCKKECQYYRCWDLSIDDYTNVCDKLHIQVDDCDAYSPFYIPRFCPLEIEGENKE